MDHRALPLRQARYSEPVCAIHHSGVDDLLRNWRTCVTHLTRATSADVVNAGRDLVQRWSEPHRSYHDVEHLQAVLRHIGTLRSHATDPEICMVAAWFHDAVYEGRPGVDERASAALAAEVLERLGVPGDLVKEVVRLVELTATHTPEAGDANGAVLCDADLAILGSPPAEYAAYTAAVRDEYAHVPEADFHAGRAAVLRHLLARDPLYATSTARELWEDRARHNITTELARMIT